VPRFSLAMVDWSIKNYFGRCQKMNSIDEYSVWGLTVLEWNFVLLHCQAARGALTAGAWGYPSLVSTSDGWSYPTPFWRLGVCTTVPRYPLPLFQSRQAARGAVTTRKPFSGF
jgi:hypothetical protein